jgi:LmbE family N-acetylglucosaminyl deacetylase
MISTDLDTPSRVLAIGAHPDDIEFGCGATLAKWASQGAEVHLCVLTDGSKGTWNPARDSGELVATRQREQRRAADRLGATEVHMLGRTDGELHSDLATRALVCQVIRIARPDILLGHDPWKRYRVHPDHRHAGFLAIEGVVAARDPLFFPEQGLATHRPSYALLFEPDEIDHVEIVDAEHVTARIDALLLHESQYESTMDIAGEAPRQRHRFIDRQRTECATAGGLVGTGFGEAFKLLVDL